MLTEILQDRALAGVRLARTPVVCSYGEADDLLRLLVPRGAAAYEAALRQHCPRILFQPLPASHFLRGHRLRQHLRGLIRTAFKTPARKAKKALTASNENPCGQRPLTSFNYRRIWA